MFSFQLVVVLLSVLQLAFAHPSVYPLPKGSVNCSNFPPAISYHVHIVFMLTNNKQIAAADALRDEAIEHFADITGSDHVCRGTKLDSSGRYDNGKFCFTYDHPINETLKGAPFPVGEWSAFVPVPYYYKVVSWFVQHRGEFSLLVHPNTGCEYEDHSIWAQWSGNAWNLDMSIFTPLTQTNEFDQKPGTAQNPICLNTGAVCGSSVEDVGYSAPQVVCCSGLACNCPGNGDCTCGGK